MKNALSLEAIDKQTAPTLPERKVLTITA